MLMGQALSTGIEHIVRKLIELVVPQKTYLAVELVAGFEPDILTLSEVEYCPSQFDGATHRPLQQKKWQYSG